MRRRYLLNREDNRVLDRRINAKKESYCTEKCEGVGIPGMDIEDCVQRVHRMRKPKTKREEKEMLRKIMKTTQNMKGEEYGER